MSYDFGPQHPLKPVRLERTMAVLEACVPGLEFLDPGLGDVDDVLRVHSEGLVEVVRQMGDGRDVGPEVEWSFGFSKHDTPPFKGMFDASLAYCAGSAAAARAVRDGAKLAFNMAGGLHHAKRSRANGFCVFSDNSIAAEIMREKFDRVLYVDIDLHHGDGPEAIFDEVFEVATLSIHETGRTLYPGTGFVTDTGAAGTSFNVPLEPYTTGDTWLWAFAEALPMVVDWFKPEAVVLQCGCDPQTDDPLGHLDVSVQAWLGAVELVRDLELPTVVTGGGGYAMHNVPRMWAACVLTMCGMEVPERMPEGIPAEWGMTTFLDESVESGRGRLQAEATVEVLRGRLG